jgi:hypothetical protein
MGFTNNDKKDLALLRDEYYQFFLQLNDVVATKFALPWMEKMAKVNTREVTNKQNNNKIQNTQQFQEHTKLKNEEVGFWKEVYATGEIELPSLSTQVNLSENDWETIALFAGEL